MSLSYCNGQFVDDTQLFYDEKSEEFYTYLSRYVDRKQWAIDKSERIEINWDEMSLTNRVAYIISKFGVEDLCAWMGRNLPIG